jgi:hypothetical protein
VNFLISFFSSNSFRIRNDVFRIRIRLKVSDPTGSGSKTLFIFIYKKLPLTEIYLLPVCFILKSFYLCFCSSEQEECRKEWWRCHRIAQTWNTPKHRTVTFKNQKKGCEGKKLVRQKQQIKHFFAHPNSRIRECNWHPRTWGWNFIFRFSESRKFSLDSWRLLLKLGCPS